MADELTTEEVTQRDEEPETSSQQASRLARWVHDRWDEADTAVKQDAEKDHWDEWVQAYWGESPPEITPSYREPILTTEMRDLILREAQDITDTRPKVHLTGKALPKPLLDTAKDLLQAKWEDCDVRGALLYAVVWSKVLPAGWIGVYWDPTLQDGMGDIAVCAEDPRCILPAPQARDDKTWPYVLKEDWLDLWAIRQKWPDTGMNVKEETPPTTVGRKPQTRSSPYLGPMFSSPGSSPTSNQSIPQARVVSIWVRDPGTETVLDEIKDAQGQIVSVRPRHILKYPRGRFIQVAGDSVLTDIPWRLSSFPLFRVISQPALGGFYPAPLVRDMLPIQQAVDRAWEQLAQNMERVNEGVWFTTGETGIDPSNFAPMPGMVVQGEAGSTLDMKAPPAFPESFTRAPELLASIMRRKAGQTEARAGTVKGANIGQGLLETEIAQAETPTRMTASLLYQVVRRIAQHMMETLALMYRTRRTIPFTTPGMPPKLIEWAPVDEEQARQFLANIDPSSFYPRSETLEKGLILKAASLGLVGPEYTLKHLQLPDIEDALAERKTQLFALWQQLMAKGKGRGRPR